MQLFAASLLVLFSIGYVQAETQEYAFTCVSGSDSTADCTVSGEADLTDDALAAAKALAFCSMPDNSVTDNEYSVYGCGACADAADVTGTCSSCDAYDDDSDNADAVSNCNTYVEPTISFQCYNNGTSSACTGTSISCFIASDTYIGDDATDATLIAGGCGDCTAYVAANCDACDTKSLCNNAVRVASIMGPLLALLFWLH